MTPASTPSQERTSDRLFGGGRWFRILPTLLAAGLAGLVACASAAASPTATVSVSIVAQAATHHVYVYRSPTAKKPFMQFTSPNADGSPVVFLVKSRAPGWEQVRLPVRPDGSTGWVRDRAVTLALDPFRVEVSLSKHHLTVWKGSKVVQSEPAGVGRSVLPTPGGTYYLVELLKQPNPNGVYGPYAFGLSAYSNVLFSFGGGPGEIGLHGTDDPSGLGTNVSHGCIRISNAGIAKLAALLPLGTPVVIAK